MIKINQDKKKRMFADHVRFDRDRLLEECDWRSLADAPGDRGAWLQYRQELRDITKQDGFPDNVTWPVPPSD